MSTTNTTKSTSVFDPGSMGRYQQFGGAGGNALMDMLQDPLKQTGFNQRVQMGNQFAFNLANRNNSNIMNRASLFGGNNIPGFLQNQMTNSGNWLAGQQAGNFNQNLLYADQMRQQAMGQALGYRPLQTGGTQSQTTSGLGTWLPQVAGMGLSALTMGMGAGAGGGAGKGAGFFSGANAGPTNPFNSIPFDIPAPDMGNPSFMSGMSSSGPGVWG